ncbi:MAG: M28 family peptidase [Pseudomonadota bacterium]
MKPFAFATAAAALVLAGCATAPEPSAPEAFNRQATLDIVQELSRDALFGRLPGTDGSEKARQLIIARMSAAGLVPFGEGFEQAFTYGDFADRETSAPSTPDKTGVNVVGKIEGRRDSGLTLVITAHYDHLGVKDGQIFNGADDNASGVGGILAIADYFAANPPRHDMVFVAFDAEEQGFQGARAFLNSPPIPESAMTFNLNLDMISRHEGGELWASGVRHTPALAPIVESVAETSPVPLNVGYDGTDADKDDWTGMTDSAVFFQRGIPHLYLGVEDHPDYHGPGDDFSKIKPEFYLGAVETALMIAISLDENLQTFAREEDR